MSKSSKKYAKYDLEYILSNARWINEIYFVPPKCDQNGTPFPSHARQFWGIGFTKQNGCYRTNPDIKTQVNRCHLGEPDFDQLVRQFKKDVDDWKSERQREKQDKELVARSEFVSVRVDEVLVLFGRINYFSYSVYNNILSVCSSRDVGEMICKYSTVLVEIKRLSEFYANMTEQLSRMLREHQNRRGQAVEEFRSKYYSFVKSLKESLANSFDIFKIQLENERVDQFIVLNPTIAGSDSLRREYINVSDLLMKVNSRHHRVKTLIDILYFKCCSALVKTGNWYGSSSVLSTMYNSPATVTSPSTKLFTVDPSTRYSGYPIPSNYGYSSQTVPLMKSPSTFPIYGTPTATSLENTTKKPLPSNLFGTEPAITPSTATEPEFNSVVKFLSTMNQRNFKKPKTETE